MFTRFRHDDHGMLISAEMILGIMILFSGTVIGIGTVRDTIIERTKGAPDVEQTSLSTGDGLSHSIAIRDANTPR